MGFIQSINQSHLQINIATTESLPATDVQAAIQEQVRVIEISTQRRALYIEHIV